MSQDDKVAAAGDYRGYIHVYDMIAKSFLFKVQPNGGVMQLDLAFT